MWGTYGAVVVAQTGEDILDRGRVVADEVAVTGLCCVISEDAHSSGGSVSYLEESVANAETASA